MCGIIGIIGEKKEQQITGIQKALSLLQHRGPDDSGSIYRETHSLGHTRLAIVDPEKGHQPITHNKDSLVCNGEIYNHQSLRRNMFQDNFFVSGSDNEVILPLCRGNTGSGVKKLDGMFSFIYASPEDLFIARDPLGIKPLYYGYQNGNMVLSSEIKALTGLTEKIYEFPNGYYFKPDTGFRSYYQLPQTPDKSTNPEFSIQTIRKTLQNSVRKRLMSDVPVGVFLSGGLDSSIIAALMKTETGPLHSFSTGFEDSRDLEAARKVAKHIGTIHHEYVYTRKEMLDLLPRVIYHLESFDPALVRSAIPCFILSRLASHHVKVILSGEGADELFAGYDHFREIDDPEKLHHESLRIVNTLHNINLQRLDRMTMAHGLEGRVPFLDKDMIRTALDISPELKLHKYYGIEKGLLRSAFENLLPGDIIWRDKQEFAQGCGSSEVTANYAEQVISDKELREARSHDPKIYSKEMLLYYRIFRRYFDHPGTTDLVGIWKP